MVDASAEPCASRVDGRADAQSSGSIPADGGRLLQRDGGHTIIVGLPVRLPVLTLIDVFAGAFMLSSFGFVRFEKVASLTA